MTILLFANQAETVLTVDAIYTDTVLSVATGSNFPAPATGQTLVLTLISALSEVINEVVYCTNITGNILTVVRAQEGTVARNWSAGDFISNLLTAGTAANFAQINSGSTGQRPIPTKIGQPYYDTTLGYSINCHQITPTVIWHNGQGASV